MAKTTIAAAKATTSVIRRMLPQDREYVLGYCKSTFGWGDYVQNVWDCWMRQGVFLAFEAGSSKHGRGQAITERVHTAHAVADERLTGPVGMCHVHHSKGQIWLEGIRVHRQYRRRGIAARLVSRAEQMALGAEGTKSVHAGSMYDANTSGTRGPLVSRMLIDTTNTASLCMAKALGYEKIDTPWIYYTLKSRPLNNQIYDYKICGGAGAGNDCNNDNHIHDTVDEPCSAIRTVCAHPCDIIDPLQYPYYVRSWRWFDTDADFVRAASSAGMIIISHSTKGSPRCSCCRFVSIIAISESVGRDPGPTLYCTLYAGTPADPRQDCCYHPNQSMTDDRHTGTRHDCHTCQNASAREMLCSIKRVASAHACTSVEIFAQKPLPEYEHLSKHYEFCLVEKRLR